jgi:hypothetical protein
MIRRFKTFGLAAVMAMALTAVVASAAQAAPLFHVEEAPATITGTQTTRQVFTTESGTVECENATFNGTSSVTTTASQELSASYSGCTAFFFFGATINMNGCKYKFNLVEGSSPPTATADLVCAAGKEIEIEAPFCKVTVPAQTGLKHIVFSNTGTKTGRDIDANVTIEGIKYTSQAGCSNAGTYTNGTLNGGATVKADRGNGTANGLWVE